MFTNTASNTESPIEEKKEKKILFYHLQNINLFYRMAKSIRKNHHFKRLINCWKMKTFKIKKTRGIKLIKL